MARPLDTIRAFLSTESSGGILLMVATAAALLVANTPLRPAYEAALHVHLGPLSLHGWINDALMALFFLLVGLEMKRELVRGHLARWSDRALPTIAALGGMAVPAAVYLAIAGPVDGLDRGWAIPAATDIAFAVGVLTLAGGRVSAAMKLFLVSLAIVDDMGAVAIIALFYTDLLYVPALFAAAGLWTAMLLIGRLGVAALSPYLALAALLWLAVLASGVHPTIAGVLAAFAIPIGEAGADAAPLQRLERALHPWVAFGIVPLFGFANAGLPLDGLGPAALAAPLPLAVCLGLILGKPAGVLGGIALARLAGARLTARPAEIAGVALLAGIGFTMSLFIAALAFPDAARGDAARLGVLAGSFVSALAGFAVLRLGAPRVAAD